MRRPSPGTFANITICRTPAQPHPDRAPRLQRLRAATHEQREPRRLQARRRQYQQPDPQHRRPHDRRCGKCAGCQTCHETAAFVGMVASTTRPPATHAEPRWTRATQPAGDCSGCHTTTPTSPRTRPAMQQSRPITFRQALRAPSAIPRRATTPVFGDRHAPGRDHLLDLSRPGRCHTFANITITTTSGNHIPIGTLDCNGSGCHTTANVNAGGFNIGAANITNPTLNVAGHTTVAAAVASCQTCHETAPYAGMVASTSTTAGDSLPMTLDTSSPDDAATATDVTLRPRRSQATRRGGSPKPANHIPTNAACAQCHTTAGNYAPYVMGATGHTGITNNCAPCHADGLTFANMAPPTLKQPPPGRPAIFPRGPERLETEGRLRAVSHPDGLHHLRGHGHETHRRDHHELHELP